MAVEARDLEVRYGTRVALDHVDLDAPDGQVTCLLGPSGSGKTTLLRVLAGLERAFGGRVRIDGDDVTDVPTHRRGVGLMFQEHALFPHEDVGGNVAFGLKMQHASGTAIRSRVTEVLALVGLAGFEGRAIDQLSGGEQQRVALARALAPQPRVLLLDEPLGALDRELRERLLVDLRTLFGRLGLTVVFVTHDQDEAFALGDRIVVLRDGRVEQAAPAAEVWRTPASPSVARFLGCALCEAVVDAGVACGPWGDVPVDAPDGAVQLASRPDAFRLVELAHAADARPAAVVAVGFRRDRRFVTVQPDGGGPPLTVALASTDKQPEPGTNVAFAVDPSAVSVLPRD
ncbi:MAG: iron transporter ATP-binding protein [Actinomycetia bacterium]|nr:iron transporter ATP-binding protein [Actinomycetes bacterium]